MRHRYKDKRVTVMNIFRYSLEAALIGFGLDMLIGDPQFYLHPVRLIGHIINICDRLFNRDCYSHKKRFWLGVLTALIVCMVSAGTVVCISLVCFKINTYLGIFIQGIICYFMLAAKSLKTESMRVYTALKNGNVEGGRYAVSMIVGRDTQTLDSSGIIKAAVETVAENLSDGEIAPLFYMMIGGCVPAVLYKSINTMDSMIGYKSDKYMYFGRFAARLDDVVNFIPSRLAALMLIAAAFVTGMDGSNAAKIFMRDRYRHSSPNSAQTESACAGALGIRLGGNAYYFGVLHKKPYIGDDTRQIETEDIVRANRLMYCASALTLIILALLRLALQTYGG